MRTIDSPGVRRQPLQRTATRRTRRRLIAAAMLLPAVAQTQGVSERPIRIVIPYAAGGGSDLLARTLGAGIAHRLGQPVLIDNKGGAGGAIGAQFVARSRPDGLTLLMANNAQLIGPMIARNAGYDLASDFEPMALVATSPSILVVPKGLGVDRLADFVALVKRRPNQFNFGSAGTGTPSHLTSLMFTRQAGMEMTHVRYKGSGPITAALLSAEIQMYFGTPASVEPFVRAGSVVPLAVTSRRRFPAFPEVPTVAEARIAGVSPDFGFDIWWGLMAPASTPVATLDRLRDAVRASLQDSGLRARWLALGMLPSDLAGSEFGPMLQSEAASAARLVADHQIAAD